MTIITRKTLKAIFLMATTVAILMVVLTLTPIYSKQTDSAEINIEDADPILLTPKRVSRFLTESTNQHHPHGRSLKPADHCHKDDEVCDLKFGANSTCCGNKCFNVHNDKNHCGACHTKCKYTYSCCNGKCVDLAYDKRHCGSCGNKCLLGQYCIYGMCDYA